MLRLYERLAHVNGHMAAIITEKLPRANARRPDAVADQIAGRTPD